MTRKEFIAEMAALLLATGKEKMGAMSEAGPGFMRLCIKDAILLADELQRTQDGTTWAAPWESSQSSS